jgi:hypothetical protein
MQTITTTSEQLTYGMQLWKLNCLYWDGHNYRWVRHHRAVEPAQRGKIAVAVNRALKQRFATPSELYDACHPEGNLITMPTTSGELAGLLPRGATVSTFVVNETRSGLACRLLVFAVVQGEIILVTRAVAAALGLEMHFAQLIYPATRAKAGLDLVQRLGHTLYGHTAALRHQSLGEGA